MPERTDSQVAMLLDICQQCEWYTRGSCGKCGCRCNSGGGWRNKLRRATESCPVGKWGASIMDRDAIYRAIRRRFNVRVQGDNLPIVSKHATRLDLADLWGELGYRRLAEIGVRRGSYSHELLTRVPESHLTCVDIWAPYYNRSVSADAQEKHYQATLRRLAEFIQAERVTVLRMASIAALAQVPDGSLDAVFIDGDHTFDGAVLDIVCWSRKVRSGGMVGVHDYYPMQRGGVVQAVDGYTHCHHIDPWYVTHELEPTAFWVVP